MNFSELESLMSSRGVTSLAEIARILDTTPQAVSNWKARDQVPYHIVSKINQIISSDNNKRVKSTSNFINQDENTISLSDILLTLAEQLKIIILVTFITVFISFTHAKFIKSPQYRSWATILLPENKAGNIGLISGLASQFGVNVPGGTEINLSSPSLYPELIYSRIFAEKILDKIFFIEQYEKEITLLSYITHGINPTTASKDILVSRALGAFRSMVGFDNNSNGKLSTITVTAPEANLAKELTETILVELESLNRYYKSKTVSEKSIFINTRIISVKRDLEFSEHRLKTFTEQNRQISSPALQLEFERLGRDVEIQKSIYLTLKQQQELAKIEEVQETSIIQIVDRPYLPLGPINKNVTINIILASIFGIGLGIFLAFFRSYWNNNNINERKKIRRVKNFINKKSHDFIMDRRIAGIISLLLLIGSPYYLGQKSENPSIFGIYSTKMMLINTIYVLFLLLSIGLYIWPIRKKK